MSLKINGTKSEYMDSLFTECLKKQIKTYLGNGLVQKEHKMQTEATICAAQEQALRANYTKTKIDKTPKKLCGV